jgi:hypothetical protein
MRFALAACAVLVSVSTGCSGEPEQTHFAKALPRCDAIAAVLAGQGMPSPSPAPAGSRAPSSVECSFVPPPGGQGSLIAAATVYLYRPAVDTFEGTDRPGWASGFDADNQCSGAVAADSALPGGRSCYTRTAPEAGQAKVTGYTAKTGVSVLLLWTSSGTTPDTLRTETLAKAGAVASSIAGML